MDCRRVQRRREERELRTQSHGGTEPRRTDPSRPTEPGAKRRAGLTLSTRSISKASVRPLNTHTGEKNRGGPGPSPVPSQNPKSKSVPTIVGPFQIVAKLRMTAPECGAVARP